MKVQLDTKVISSFLLYLDHVVQDEGEAFNNEVVRFYPKASPVQNTYIYTSISKPLCNDISITGAHVLSGIYINGAYASVGTSGLTSINHYQGALYFTGSFPSGTVISGDAAVKEVTIKITDKTDWKLLFETQYVSNGQHGTQPSTGLGLDTEVSPIIFLRHKAQENKPFGFARLDNQMVAMRAIVIADNEFQKIGLTSILKNLNYRPVQLVSATPFDALGNMTGINYNYNTLSIDTSVTPIIYSVKVIDIPQRGEYKDIRRNMAIVDFELGTVARS